MPRLSVNINIDLRLCSASSKTNKLNWARAAPRLNAKGCAP